MFQLKRIIFITTCLLLPILIFSQSIKDVRINEIQVINTNGLRDEYGKAVSWIELYNKGFGKVNIGSCTLKVKGKEYTIPKGDPATLMTARTYLVFYTDGTSDKGTFHTNFTLDDTDFIEFYDSDGKLIDSFTFNPEMMKDGISYGWDEYKSGVEKIKELPATTPGSSNNTIVSKSRAEVFKEADPTGFVLTLINIIFVSIALTILFFIFKYMGDFHVRRAMKKSKKVRILKTGVDTVAKKQNAVTNDELAVIAIALYQYSKQMQDYEDMTLTIGKVSRVYSPWSSKIYGLRQIPNRR